MKTEEIYARLYTWILTYGPKILLAATVLIAGQWLLKQFRKWITATISKKNIDPSLRPFLLSATVTALQVLLILGIMQILGIQMTVFAALIGGIGVALGLALSGTLQNFTSGILILLLKPYRVGDNIIAQGQEGKVTSIQIFYTVVTTFDHKTVVIPNSKLSNEMIINLSREGFRRLDIELKLGFAFSIDEVKGILLKTISSTPGVLKDKQPRIGVLAIDPDGYRLGVQVWANANGFIDTRLDFQERIIHDLKGSGIKLPGM